MSVLDVGWIENQLQTAFECEEKSWRTLAKFVEHLVDAETRRCAQIVRCEYNDCGYDCACERCRLAASLLGLEWNDSKNRDTQRPDTVPQGEDVKLCEIRSDSDGWLEWDGPAGWDLVDGTPSPATHKDFRGFQFPDGAVSWSLWRFRFVLSNGMKANWTKQTYWDDINRSKGISSVEWQHAGHVRLAKED